MSSIKSDSLKALMKTFKTDSPVLGPVHRHLMTLDPWEGRRREVIHPSELAGNDFCPRAVWYRLIGEEEKQQVVPMTREVIFEAGHEYHQKWQNWLWDAGLLGGNFACLMCGARWADVSPATCPECDAPRRMLAYKEVPVHDEETNIAGHADGLVVPTVGDQRLLEVKSVGEGTVRMYDPARLRQFTHEVDGRKIVDHRAMWNSIKQPMVPHLRQVTIYGRILGVKKAVILYESKATGQLKEFTINLRFESVENRFEAARDIMAAVRSGVPPTCSKRGGGCSLCRPFESEKSDEQETEEGTSRRSKAARRRSSSDAAGSGTGSRRAARREAASAGLGHRRSADRGPDGVVQGTRRLVRLRQQSAD